MFKNFLKNFIIPALIGVVVALLIRNYLFQFYTVDGASMEPTFEDGNLVMGYTFKANMEHFEHSDVAVIKAHQENSDEKVFYIKRIIALENDLIEFKNEEDDSVTSVYLNGELLKETYIKEDFYHPDAEITVPKGKVFVMGDNRNHSSDSRNLGFFDYEDLVSIVEHTLKK